jgi:hypothetical protein
MKKNEKNDHPYDDQSFLFFFLSLATYENLNQNFVVANSNNEQLIITIYNTNIVNNKQLLIMINSIINFYLNN